MTPGTASLGRGAESQLGLVSSRRALSPDGPLRHPPAPVDNALGPWLASVVSGTLGAGGSVTWQGSVDGGTTWFTLNDDTGAALTMAALNTNKPVKERPLLVRPNCTAGDGTTSLKCVLVIRK